VEAADKQNADGGAGNFKNQKAKIRGKTPNLTADFTD
jgi:hypothetical protein